MPENDPRAATPTPPPQAPVGALRAIAELGRIDFTRHDLRGVLGEVAALARLALVSGDAADGGGSGEVSVTLLRGTAAYTAVFTGALALALDETQYESGYGPCIDAAAAGEMLLITDMATETRWPAFAHAATRAGIGSSLSLSLPLQQEVTGALNIYSPRSGHFHGSAIALGVVFAGYAAVAIGNAHLYDDATTQARQMREAMEHRAVIEQAKGIIMGDRRCTAAEAFEILRGLSNTTNRKLHTVAEALVARATATTHP